MIIAVTHYRPDNPCDANGKLGTYKLALLQGQLWCSGVARAFDKLVNRDECVLVDVGHDDAVHAKLIIWCHGVTSSIVFSRVEMLHRHFAIPILHVNVSIDYQVDPLELWPIIPEHMLSAFQIDKNALVLCTDTTSRAVVQSYGLTSRVAVCPTQFISDNPRIGQRAHDNWTETPYRTLRLGVFLSGWSDPLHAHVSKSMMHAMYRYNATCLCQTDAGLAHALYISKTKDKTFYKKNIALLSVFPGSVEFELAMSRQNKLFSSADEWSAFVAENIDFLVTSNAHCLSMAIQLGVPGICICMDQKTLNACNSMNLPCMWHDDLHSRFDLMDVFDDFEWHAVGYDEQRLVAAQTYVALFEELGIPASSHLLALSTTEI